MRNKEKALRHPYIAQCYRKNRCLFGISLLMTLLTAFINLVLAWLLQQTTDTVSRVPGSYSIGQLTLMLFGVIAAIILFKAIGLWSKPRFMHRAMRQYKDYAFSMLMRKSMASFEKEASSLYLSAFSNDAATMEEGYLENQFTLVSEAVLLIGSLLMMLAYSPLMTLIAMAFFVLPVVVSLAAGGRAAAAERQVSDSNASLIAALKEALGGFQVVKAFQAEEAVQRQFAQSNLNAENAKRNKRRIAIVISILAAVAGVTAQMGTFLAGGAMAINGQHITPGMLLLFLDLTANVINPIRNLPELLAKRKAALGLVDKLAQALLENAGESGLELTHPLQSGITLRDLSFGYEEKNPVLKQLNCRFEAGKSYAIVGASGSGKSTLLHLLMASHGHYQGSATFDGVELRDISSQSLYKQMSLIQQQVYVFNASVRDNITMFRPFPREMVNRVLKQAGLTELIAARGEDALCGENGCWLSGGEKQRISIARALLRGSCVLLADEATASLDAQTAHQVSSAILSLSQITRIVVTHQLDAALLRKYDGILVMKNGSVAESGTFDELMARKGYFYSLYTVAQ